MSEMKGRFGLDAEWLYWGFPRSWGGGARSPAPDWKQEVSVLSARLGSFCPSAQGHGTPPSLGIERVSYQIEGCQAYCVCRCEAKSCLVHAGQKP